MLRKYLKYILILTILISIFLIPTATAYGETSYSIRALMPCKLYSDVDFTNVIADIQQNEKIDVITDLDTILKVSVNGQIGYMRAEYAYSTDTDFSKKTKTMSINTGSLTEEAPVYEYPFEDSQVLDTLKDNSKVEVVENNMSYGDFAEIKYNGQRAFVKKSLISEGLTYTTTIIIVLSVVGAVLLVILILLIVFGVKLKKR